LTSPTQKTTTNAKPITFNPEMARKKLSEFWRGLENGKIYASKCRNCGTLSFPPVADCSKCMSSDPEWIEIEGEGEIETFTKIMIRPKSFADHPPYTVAVAKMREGVKILASITVPDESKLKIGARIKLITKKAETGSRYEFTLQ